MRRLLFAAAFAFVTSPAFAQSPTCTTAQPGPAWVCVSGGWLPPGHPSIPTATPAPVPVQPPFDQPAPKRAFWIGHRYTRGTTDVAIVGTGQMPGGIAVLFALCNQVGDGCFTPGYVRMFVTNADSSDWTHWGPY